jgi:outer membrane protein OmpA-like peptidoglycan-associated protein
MNKFKLFLVFAAGALLAGCASAPKEEAAQKKYNNPIVEREMKKNEKLAKQTVRQMARSRQVPSVDFEFDSIHLAPTAYPTLDKVAEIMNANRFLKLIVEGHTDTVGSHEYNDWLSAARAMSVKSYLVSRGVYPDSIQIYGYGKRYPLTKDDSPEGRNANRRVRFIFTDRHWQSVY